MPSFVGNIIPRIRMRRWPGCCANRSWLGVRKHLRANSDQRASAAAKHTLPAFHYTHRDATMARAAQGQTYYEDRVCMQCMYVCLPSWYVCLPSWYVCMPSWYVCILSWYVCISSLYVCLGKIMLWRRGQIPHENLSVFDV